MSGVFRIMEKKDGYLDAAWSEEKVVKVPLAMPLQIASVSSGVSRRGGEQTALAPCAILAVMIGKDFLGWLPTMEIIAFQFFS